MVKRINLNTTVDRESASASASVEGTRPPRRSKNVCFHHIEEFIAKKLKKVDSVKGVICWLSSPTLLNMLHNVGDVKIAVTNDTFSKRVREAYRTLPGIRTIGQKRGRYRHFCHHKFLIGYKNEKPIFVLNGSYNWSSHSSGNLENVCCLTTKSLINAFEQEFESVYKVSKKMRSKRSKK
jgi:phosphatidylserine/phosphatidylglycerophosphate/cardiolipin synthase-like enzyme